MKLHEAQPSAILPSSLQPVLLHIRKVQRRNEYFTAADYISFTVRSEKSGIPR